MVVFWASPHPHPGSWQQKAQGLTQTASSRDCAPQGTLGHVQGCVRSWHLVGGMGGPQRTTLPHVSSAGWCHPDLLWVRCRSCPTPTGSSPSSLGRDRGPLCPPTPSLPAVVQSTFLHLTCGPKESRPRGGLSPGDSLRPLGSGHVEGKHPTQRQTSTAGFSGHPFLSHLSPPPPAQRT